MGIRGQLTLLIPGVLALTIAIGGGLFLEAERRDALNEFRVLHEKVLQAVGVTVAVEIAQNDMSGLDTLVAQLTDALRERDLKELAVLDEEGRVLAHSSPERFNTVLTDDFNQRALRSDLPSWRHDDTSFYLAIPAWSGIRWGTVSAVYSLERLELAYRKTLRQLISLALILFSFIGGVLFMGVDRLVVRPIRTLQQAVRRMGEGQFSVRVPPLKGKELKELSETVNRMSASLQSERDDLERAVNERTKELQEVNARLQLLAVTDGLTGVFNHRRFQEALQAERLRADRHKRPMSVLMIDVDFFKKINDSMGHPAGDELLRRLAEILSADLRQTDLIARYGGEEFTVLLPETSKFEALQVGERMRAAVESKVGTRWGQAVTVSIGVATLPEDAPDAEGVLDMADQAMYVAKRQGRNRVVGARSA